MLYIFLPLQCLFCKSRPVSVDYLELNHSKVKVETLSSDDSFIFPPSQLLGSEENPIFDFDLYNAFLIKVTLFRLFIFMLLDNIS